MQLKYAFWLSFLLFYFFKNVPKLILGKCNCCVSAAQPCGSYFGPEVLCDMCIPFIEDDPQQLSSKCNGHKDQQCFPHPQWPQPRAHQPPQHPAAQEHCYSHKHMQQHHGHGHISITRLTIITNADCQGLHFSGVAL